MLKYGNAHEQFNEAAKELRKQSTLKEKVSAALARIVVLDDGESSIPDEITERFYKLIKVDVSTMTEDELTHTKAEIEELNAIIEKAFKDEWRVSHKSR